MGNTSTRETGSPYAQGHSRSASSSSRYRSGSNANDGRSSNPFVGGSGIAPGPGAAGSSSYSSRRERDRDRDRDAESRARNLEHALFGLGIVGSGSGRHERSARSREEEREAREARKAEREREREKERQRSLREESCDGGFLVTQGVYTGPQDFKEKIVRHLMLERKLAPFWKGLPDFEEDWTDAQIVAAVRGLPIPGPEVECESESPLAASPAVAPTNPNASDPALHLTVPIGTRSRSHSYTSDCSSRSGGNTAPSTSRARSKTLTISSPCNPVQIASTTNPLETNIQGNYVDGRPIEAALYKNAKECPICFLYYPPWMNRTRCCDYDICSECFVQIKRADPHLPEHEQIQNNNGESFTNPDLLISEPASCPFCKETDFGVVYSPPPFRRGLVYSDSLAPSYIAGLGLGDFNTPDSSVPQSPSTPSSPPPGTGSRRKQAFASTAAEVVTTDQIRPDWAHKLQSARNQAARRAAAATALHNAAFLLSNTTRESGNSSGSGGGSGSFASRRLMRRAGLPGTHGSESPSPGGSGTGTPRAGGERLESLSAAGLGLMGIGGNGRGPDNSPAATRRRSRMVDLEEMMLREAIRLSILEEEERKKKEEAEARKKEEEERLKAERGSAVGGEVGESSANGKGKAVERSNDMEGESSSSSLSKEGEASASDNSRDNEEEENIRRLRELSLNFGSLSGMIDEGTTSGGASQSQEDVIQPVPQGNSESSSDAAEAKAVEAGIQVETMEGGRVA